MDYSIFSRFRNCRLFAGYSGGADSTALLILACQGAEHYGYDLTAVHFNHHLRGAESDAEAREAEKFARQLGVKFLLVDLNIAHGNNLEARARAARWKKFRELAGNDPQAAVLLGHHADDRVENMFLRLLRGSNSSALAGLRQESTLGGVRIFRPFADRSKAEITAFLREQGIDRWAHDSSNDEDIYARNYLRNRIIPQLTGKFPQAPQALRISLENLECDAGFIEKEAEKLLAEKDAREVSFWQGLHPALAVRCLRIFLDGIFGEALPPSRDSVNRFLQMTASGGDGVVEIDGSRSLRIAGKRIAAAGKELPETVEWQWRKTTQICWQNWRFSVSETDRIPENVPLDTAYFNGALLPEKLLIGAPLEGETMLPFGRKQAVKIKDLRIKRKIPAYPPVPVVRDGNRRVIWLPSIRHSGEFPVTAGAKILVFFAEKIEEFD